MFVVSVLGREAVLLEVKKGLCSQVSLVPGLLPYSSALWPLNLLSLSFLLSNEGNMRTFLIGFMRTKK